MGIKIKGDTIRKFAVKYKYVIAIIVIGLLLMLIPEKNNKPHESVISTPIASDPDSVEDKLEKLLSSVHGAGEVHVLLTTLSGEETIYKTDEQGSGDNINSDTVIITDSDRNQSGLIQQRNPPVYRGAVVVCAGADKPDVRLAITDAVIKATGLRSDQISVLKMK